MLSQGLCGLSKLAIQKRKTTNAHSIFSPFSYILFVFKLDPLTLLKGTEKHTNGLMDGGRVEKSRAGWKLISTSESNALRKQTHAICCLWLNTLHTLISAHHYSLPHFNPLKSLLKDGKSLSLSRPISFHVSDNKGTCPTNPHV